MLSDGETPPMTTVEVEAVLGWGKWKSSFLSLISVFESEEDVFRFRVLPFAKSD